MSVKITVGNFQNTVFMSWIGSLLWGLGEQEVEVLTTNQKGPGSGSGIDVYSWLDTTFNWGSGQFSPYEQNIIIVS